MAAVVDQWDSIYLYPIVIWGDTGLTDPLVGEWGDSSFEKFAGTYFRRGQAYSLYSAGVRQGASVVANVERTACSGIVASAQPRLVPPKSAQVASVRLATNAKADWTGPVTIRQLSPLERQWGYAAMSDSLAVREIPDSLRGTADSVWGWMIPTSHGDTAVLVAAMTSMLPDNEGDHEVSLLFIIEVQRKGRRLAYAKLVDAHEADVARFDPVDVTDMDHDGWPEIIVQNQYYESHDYTILERTGGRWGVAYTGGSSGC
jgi:hypothetical protein